jgi:hypothetical protein
MTVTEHTAQLVHTFKEQEMKTYLNSIPLADWLEKSWRVCPVDDCGNMDISEAPEETMAKGKITALISVPNSEVNTRLAEGYEVMEDKIYAKEIIMVKRDGISKEASVEIASAQEAYGKIDLADKMAKAARTAEKSFEGAK